MSELKNIASEDSTEHVVTDPALNEQDVPESPKAPPPSVTGNLQIEVYKHRLVEVEIDPVDRTLKIPAGVEVAIGNVSDKTLATVVFESVFYDKAGNILDTVKHREVDLPPGTSRAILIKSRQDEPSLVQSYTVRLLHTTTTEVEKVQLRRHAIKTIETGQVAIQGVVKNISPVILDAVVVATFFDVDKETIGTKAVALKDLEPGTIRQYELLFKPQEGDLIAGYNLFVAEIAR